MSTPALDADCGLLFVGHGTRDAAGTSQFLQLATLLQQCLPDTPVEPCFLELAEPTIEVGLQRLVGRGVSRIVVSPALLFSAGHIQHDIPVAVRDAVNQLGGARLDVVQAAHLGCHPLVVELSRQRYEDAAQSHPIPAAAVDFSADATGLVMIGRGSRDQVATAEMQQFLALRRTQSPVAQAWLGFVAMAQPTTAAVLAAAAASGLARIVVQPHLLFAGQILTDLHRQVDELRRTQSRIQWIVTAPLGVDVLLARTLAELAIQAIIPAESFGILQ